MQRTTIQRCNDSTIQRFNVGRLVVTAASFQRSRDSRRVSARNHLLDFVHPIVGTRATDLCRYRLLPTNS